MTLKHKVRSLIDTGWLKFEENRLLNPNIDKQHCGVPKLMTGLNSNNLNNKNHGKFFFSFSSFSFSFLSLFIITRFRRKILTIKS